MTTFKPTQENRTTSDATQLRKTEPRRKKPPPKKQKKKHPKERMKVTHLYYEKKIKLKQSLFLDKMHILSIEPILSINQSHRK